MAAVDRLFDEFVWLVIIGVVIGIALCVIKAFKKMFRGME